MSLSSRLERKKQEALTSGRGDLVSAHAHTVRHRKELEASSLAGCFYCCETFASVEIEDWVDNDGCALCPRCGIDSVLGDASGYPIAEPKFLKDMHDFWFSTC